MTVRLLVVGDIVTDVVVIPTGPIEPGTDTAASITTTGGGSAANTAAWLAAAGAQVWLAAAAGTDGAGALRLAELRALGVHCTVPPKAGAGTGSVVVLSTGDDRTMIADRGANLLLHPSDIDEAWRQAPAATHLHLSGYALFGDDSDGGSGDGVPRAAGRHALARAADRGATISVDAGSAGPLRRVGAAAFRSWVRPADLLLANAAEAAVLAGRGGPPAELARRLAETVPNAVVKCAAAGAVWATRDGVTSSAAAPVRVVDPTGAGDAFAAGLLASWLAGDPPPAALAAGVRLGTAAVTRVGARPPVR